MRTLPELLDAYKITSRSDRLEFEEVVNEVVRKCGGDLQAAQEKHDASVEAIREKANAAIEKANTERDSMQTILLEITDKTARSVKTAVEAIANPNLDDAATLEALKGVIADVTKDDRQRQRELLEASIAAQQAQLAAL